MFKKGEKYYNISKDQFIRRPSNSKRLAGFLLTSVAGYLLNLHEFSLIRKHNFKYRQITISYGLFTSFFELKDFTTMGYYRARRLYTVTMVHLWKYMKYIHLLKKDDQELFIQFIEVLIDYWILCDNVKTYKHFINYTNLIYDTSIQYLFKDYLLFSKKNIKKFLNFNDYRELKLLNETIYLE